MLIFFSIIFHLSHEKKTAIKSKKERKKRKTAAATQWKPAVRERVK